MTTKNSTKYLGIKKFTTWLTYSSRNVFEWIVPQILISLEIKKCQMVGCWIWISLLLWLFNLCYEYQWGKSQLGIWKEYDLRNEMVVSKYDSGWQKEVLWILKCRPTGWEDKVMRSHKWRFNAQLCRGER